MISTSEMRATIPTNSPYPFAKEVKFKITDKEKEQKIKKSTVTPIFHEIYHIFRSHSISKTSLHFSTDSYLRKTKLANFPKELHFDLSSMDICSIRITKEP